MEEYGKCEVCKKTMNVGLACKGKIQIGKKLWDRVPYGEKGEDTESPCHDCNVTGGQIHHWGCDSEWCPKCGGQALGCECKGKYQVIVEVPQ